jgi:hypothetical protein
MNAIIEWCWKALEEFDPNRKIKLAAARQVFLHRSWNELQTRLLNHRDAGPCLCCHRQWIDSQDLKQLADASVTEPGVA